MLVFTGMQFKEFTYIYDHYYYYKGKKVINNCGKTVT